MGELAAAACHASPEQSLVLSTGIIGEFLPLPKIAAGIATAASQLAADDDAVLRAARGIMTTDRYEKIATRHAVLGGNTVRVLGIAKGAGMIGPRMATMLAVVMTDMALEPAEAQQALAAAVEGSFNCISVEGHTSTNDTVLLLASGKAAGRPVSPDDRAAFQAALNAACVELARLIPADGEGASHLITIDVTGCASREAARRIAETIANSALVKTAVAGGDPNWGRIVSAAGYAGVPFDPAGVSLQVNDHLLFQNGEPVPFDARQVSAAIQHSPETHIQLALREGDQSIRFWTSDLTVDYVKLNAEYHT
jgi:glutamate N-acetyltransferase/amino-acid N-acetyltransferase